MIDLALEQEVEGSLIVRNLSQERTNVSLAIRPPKNEVQNSFIRYGKITVQLDAALMKAWHLGQHKAKGFRIQGNDFVITNPSGAVFENLVTDPGFAGNLKLIFRKGARTPSRRFTIDVMQSAPMRVSTIAVAGGLSVSGGISYEIHTDVTDYERK